MSAVGSGERATRAWIALGSNVGARRATLAAALERLDALPGVEVLRASSWHETEPVGGPPGQRRFLNGVAELATTLTASRLLDALLAVERALGRDRSGGVRNAPRTLDLDLLLFGDVEVDSDALTVPHPRLEERTFVLAPLAELEPELRLPGSGRTVRERLAELEGAPARPAGGP